MAARDELNVQVFHDERAASFAALGVGLQGVPALLLCTSGTAAAHFHAAVIEAHQAAVAMIVCTADRPPELRDVGAPQTIDQTKLYGAAVRWFHEPGVADAAAAHTWRSLAAHAWDASMGPLPGPVHLNLAFREPLVGEPNELPVRRRLQDGSVITATCVFRIDGELAALLHQQRGVIVSGRGSPSSPTMVALSRALRWPIFADARSGLRHLDAAVTTADELVRVSEMARLTPAVVLRFGEPPASKVLNSWLLAAGCTQIHISDNARWIDSDAAIAMRIVGDVDQIARALAAAVAAAVVVAPDGRWLTSWLAANGRAEKAITHSLGTELSEPQIARVITAGLAAGSQLVVSSSMPIRDVEWFGRIGEGVTVHSNRGANGIDGVIATAIGVAVATSQPTTVLIGDVAFLHDSTALVGLAKRGLDLRIVVVDNDGGGIFSFLPQGTVLAPERFEQLFGTPHGTQLALLSTAHGLACHTATTVDELRAAAQHCGPSVTVVKTNRRANVVVHQAIHDAVAESLIGFAVGFTAE